MRSAAIALLTGCLLVSCSSGPGESGTPQPASTSPAQTSPTSPAPTSTADATSAPEPGALPEFPSREPGRLARELDRAIALLDDRRSTPAEVRRAGEYQQLAVRQLATGTAAFRRGVLRRVHPRTASVVGADVEAAGSLIRLTTAQPRLPKWRIVAPPPPAELRRYYSAAQRRTGVHWTYLAAIHLVETRMGRIRGTSTAGAQGPMQFLPSTWAEYGAGGDINDPRDAILAAARLLQANGAPEAMAAALYRYNPSDHYVRAVTAHARTMQRHAFAFRGYYHWRVLYRHVRGVHLLAEGYPDVAAVLLEPAGS